MVQLKKCVLAVTAALALWAGSAPVLAQVNQKELVAGAPSVYIVKKGDTLWDISGKFLKSPWKWPQIWRINKDRIKNPHLIYPGDRIILVIVNGQATLQIERLSPRVREEPYEELEIPTIPSTVIKPFLTRPLVIEANGLSGAPQIVASEEARMNIGTGGHAYVSGLKGEQNERFAIYRPGRILIDPETNKPIAYEAIFLGEARIVRAGEPAKIRVTSSRQEIGPGDRLVKIEEDRVFAYVPSVSESNVSGRIITIHDGRSGASLLDQGGRSRGHESEAGVLSIIVLNRGTNDGIDVGNVFTLKRPGQVVVKRNSFGYSMGTEVAEPVKIPDEEYGQALVFRSFGNVSYAIVMKANMPVRAFDIFVNPRESSPDSN
jgi:hypothetical protein